MEEVKEASASDSSEAPASAVLEETAAETAAPADPPPAPEPPAALKAERDQLAAEKAEVYDRLLRRQAEFDNYRKRAEREKGEFWEKATMETIRAILPVLDDFERALKVEGAGAEYARGMELISQRLLDTLTRMGLEPIVSEGAKFDPNLHQALDTQPSEEHEEDTVLQEYQKGYNYKGKLLRAAMVKVSVRPPQ